MATKIRMEYDSAGFRQILKSDKTADVCREAGVNIAIRANQSIPQEVIDRFSGAGHEQPSFMYRQTYLSYGGGRVGGFVVCHGAGARYAESKYKTLTKAVSGS